MSTPLMRQYHEIKQQFPDTLVLFQVGDFYELFHEDAQKASAFLGITLTKRGYHNGEPIPLCGVPVHTKDHYITKLVRGGFCVALVDQLTPAMPGRVVERGVSCVLTPGTLTDTKVLSEKKASYLGAVLGTQTQITLAFCELLTGEIWCTFIDAQDNATLESELARFAPDEVLVRATENRTLIERLKKWGFLVSPVTESSQFECGWGQSARSPNVQQLVQNSLPAQQTLALLQAYMRKTHHHFTPTQINYYAPHDFLLMHAATQRNLELVVNLYDQSTHNTLFGWLDQAVTAMGSRTLKKWIMRPLIKYEAIMERQEKVNFLYTELTLRELVRTHLREIGDLERVIGRIALKRATVSDYQQLKRTLPVLKQMGALLPQEICDLSTDFTELHTLLAVSIHDDPLATGIIAAGYDAELDRLRGLLHNGTHEILALERREIERTGIGSLKIKHNQIQGYAIEITKAQSEFVPADYQLIQQLVNRDRYTIPELKKLEFELRYAQEHVTQRESELFARVSAHVLQYSSPLRLTAQRLAELDALGALAQVAYTEQYVRPVITEKREYQIRAGKHPVVAALLKHAYVPNDLALSPEARMWVITGPNMGGKSTFMRQVALTSIMAQIGSFVPAASAQVPIFDHLFTRIGASDSVSQGKSTFFIEMEETAYICERATAHSLILLDEIGRGTSTYDGLALAQAIIEHIAEQVGALCLCATHYLELAAVAERDASIKPYQAAVELTSEGALLLHKIVPGVAAGSFGIQVARDAHLPRAVIERAQVLLSDLQSTEIGRPPSPAL